jgi:hypothetical protein
MGGMKPAYKVLYCKMEVCMCDDFWEDVDGIDDDYFTSDINLNEDLSEPFDNTDESSSVEQNQDYQKEEDNLLDKVHAIALGSMIAGNAYEEALDQSTRKALLQNLKRKNR